MGMAQHAATVKPRAGRASCGSPGEGTYHRVRILLGELDQPTHGHHLLVPTPCPAVSTSHAAKGARQTHLGLHTSELPLKLIHA